jgi:hypothetical protein
MQRNTCLNVIDPECSAGSYWFHPDMTKLKYIVSKCPTLNHFKEIARLSDLCIVCYLPFALEYYGTKVYSYHATFTLKPGMEEHYEFAEQWVKDRIKMDYIRHCTYAKEYTQKGVAHWHALLVSTKALNLSTHFAHFTKTYGGVKLQLMGPTASDRQQVLDYISKDSPAIDMEKPEKNGF